MDVSAQDPAAGADRAVVHLAARLPPQAEPGDGAIPAVAHPLVDLVANYRAAVAERARRDDFRRHPAQRLARLELGVHVQPAEALHGARRLHAVRIGYGTPQQLESAAQAEDVRTAGISDEPVERGCQAGGAQPGQGQDRGARAGQDDQVRPVQLGRLADVADRHAGRALKGGEVGEVAQPGQAQNGDIELSGRRLGPCQAERVLLIELHR